MPSQNRLYYVSLSKVVAANSQDFLQYTVPAGQRHHLKGWRWTSTGTFNLIDIVDSESVHFGLLSAQQPIQSTFLQSPTSNALALKDFPTEMIIEQLQSLNLVVVDTSAAQNTIRVVLEAYIEYV